MTKSQGSLVICEKHSIFITTKDAVLPPDISPSAQPQPFMPLLAPSPLTPFTNNYVPKLSVCPLTFPNVTSVVKECGNVISNQTACCKAIKSYVSYLQDQSFITNLQALKCAASLSKKLQNANVSNNVYNLCLVGPKDFSLQVGSQESGCLLPSLPSNAEFDKTSGIGFMCDLNDNIVAPWTSSSNPLLSSCNRTTKLPSLPTTTSSQNGLFTPITWFYFTSSLLYYFSRGFSNLEVLFN